MFFQNSVSPFSRTTLLTALSVTTLFLLTACGGGGGDGDPGDPGNPGVAGLSQHGSTNSHTDSRLGQDCMDCHTNGPGIGVFISSGTAISAAGGYVEYYATSGRTGMPNVNLQIDAYGNFYTVTAIDLLTDGGSGSPGAYVTIVMPNGSRRNMPGNISHLTPSCNECHGAAGAGQPSAL